MRWLVVLLLLISVPAYADSRLLFLAANSGIVPFTVNGYSSVVTTGTIDTGTESIQTGAGNITADASCTAYGGGGTQTAAHMYVDDVEVDSLTCNNGSSSSKTLTATVTAGSHNIRFVVDYDYFLDFAQIINFRKKSP